MDTHCMQTHYNISCTHKTTHKQNRPQVVIFNLGLQLRDWSIEQNRVTTPKTTSQWHFHEIERALFCMYVCVWTHVYVTDKRGKRVRQSGLGLGFGASQFLFIRYSVRVMMKRCLKRFKESSENADPDRLIAIHSQDPVYKATPIK